MAAAARRTPARRERRRAGTPKSVSSGGSSSPRQIRYTEQMQKVRHPMDACGSHAEPAPSVEVHNFSKAHEVPKSPA